MRQLLQVVLSCATVLFTAAAPAQAPLRMVVPFPAGGSADLIGRTVARRMGEVLQQTVVVENRVGAGGIIGVEQIARAAPDGLSFGLGTVSTLAMAPLVQPKLSYDPLKSLAPVNLIASAPFFLVVHPALPVRNLQELVAHAKAQPGRLGYASIGNGTLLHFAGEQLKNAAGIDMLHVAYKGAAPALVALLGNEVQVMFDQLASFQLQNLRSGRLRAIAVLAPTRSPQMPEVPTTAEAGLGELDISAWFALVVPAGTPAAAIARLREASDRALASDEVREVFRSHAMEAGGGGPERLGALIRSESDKWRKIIRASGFKTD